MDNRTNKEQKRGIAGGYHRQRKEEEQTREYDPKSAISNKQASHHF